MAQRLNHLFLWSVCVSLRGRNLAMSHLIHDVGYGATIHDSITDVRMPKHMQGEWIDLEQPPSEIFDFFFDTS